MLRIGCEDYTVDDSQEGEQTSIAYLWRQTPMQTPVDTDEHHYNCYNWEALSVSL